MITAVVREIFKNGISNIMLSDMPVENPITGKQVTPKEVAQDE